MNPEVYKFTKEQGFDLMPLKDLTYDQRMFEACDTPLKKSYLRGEINLNKYLELET